MDTNKLSPRLLSNDNMYEGRYDSYVVIDGTGAIILNSESLSEACSYAYELVQQYRTYHCVTTFEVYGCESGAYSTDENNSTLVYSTDNEI